MSDVFIFSFGLINGISFILMAYDKHASKRKKWRISEQMFMILTLLGGIIGIVLAALMFNHKISKRSFQVKIGISFILFIIILYNLSEFI